MEKCSKIKSKYFFVLLKHVNLINFKGFDLIYKGVLQNCIKIIVFSPKPVYFK